MKTINRWIGVFETIFIGGSIIISVLISCAGVFFRYVLNNSLGWVEEMAGLLLFFSVTAGIGAAVHQGKHLRMDLPIKLNPKTKKGVDIYIDLIALVVMTILFFLSVEFFLHILKGWQKTTSLYWLPLGIPLIIMPIGYLIALFRIVEHFLKTLKTSHETERRSA